MTLTRIIRIILCTHYYVFYRVQYAYHWKHICYTDACTGNKQNMWNKTRSPHWFTNFALITGWMTIESAFGTRTNDVFFFSGISSMVKWFIYGVEQISARVWCVWPNGENGFFKICKNSQNIVGICLDLH